VVIGCGAVGLNVLQGAKLVDAGQIIAVDVGKARLDRALHFGATHAVDASSGDALDQIRALTQGRGADYVFEAAGNKKKIIEEYFGLVNSKDAKVSIAKMISPSGWSEPGQTPDFDEYTVVLKGMLRVESRDGVHEIRAGEAILVTRGDWVRYASPGPEGAEYVAVCLPAFSPATVHRDE
jgi:threonine dehydrogenase-like Zn-dependent dehydrogenase